MKTWAALVLLLSAPCARAAITPLACAATGVPTLVHAEGLTEQLGDLRLTCQGIAGGTVTASLRVFLTVNITNKLSAAEVPDVALTIDLGAGPVPLAATTRMLGVNSITFDNINFAMPPSGAVVLTIGNLRGAIHPLSGELPVQALLATGGLSAITVQNNRLTVGVASRGLLSASGSTAVLCTGSPLPSDLMFTTLLATGTRNATVRVTEGYSESFQRRQAPADAGTRILLRYLGFPAGARLFVPDIIAGSNTVFPTSTGDLGAPQSPGVYSPGPDGALVLARVRYTDSTGAGGFAVYTPAPVPSGAVTFDGVSEVDLVNGAGIAVFEVVDSNATMVESAQIPSFLGLAPGSAEALASIRVSFGPVSTLTTASNTAPVPRFVEQAPPSDCTVLRDCGAAYFPRLFVDSEPLRFLAVVGTGFQVKYVRVNNIGGSLMTWTVAVNYRIGAGWLRVAPTAGLNNGTVRVDALPETLTPGVYEAVIIVDGGTIAGSRTLPVVLEVTAAPPPPATPPPVIREVTNAATFAPGPVVAGSLATIKGLRLAGRTVTVTMDGFQTNLLFVGAEQINLLVPTQLGRASSAFLVVTVDGISSSPLAVPLALAAPGIFAGGVLNQDGIVNSEAAAARVASIVQIFATGLPLPELGTISARIHDRDMYQLHYGGPAPNVPGVQQVNLVVPDDLPAMTADVVVCGAPRDNPTQRTCSPAAPISIRR